MAAIIRTRIERVVEPVVVWLVFLAILVVEHLHTLAVLDRQEADVADAPFYPPENLRNDVI